MPIAEKKTLTITVVGKKPHPDANSFAHIIQETVVVLDQIDAEISKGKTRPIVWRIASVSMNTPISITLEADSDANQRNPGKKVISACLRGLGQLEKKPKIPSHYNTRAVSGVKAIVNALNNGVAGVEFSSPGQKTQAPTLRAATNIEEIFSKRPGAFHQLSSIEGRLELISMHGGLMAHIFNLRTGEKTSCNFDASLLSQAMKCFGKRVAAYGRVSYSREGKAVAIEARQIRAMKGRDDLPQFADLEGIDITEGVDPTEYIGRLRDAN